MIAIDQQSFSIVEDIGFIRLLNHVCPNYQIPSRKYIDANIDRIYTWYVKLDKGGRYMWYAIIID